MDIKIAPANLRGNIEAVSSKSYAHRLFLASALADGCTEIYLKNGSSDLTTTLEVLKNFGVRVAFNGANCTVTPIDYNAVPQKLSVNLRDSLATLRFLLPIISAITGQVTYDGEGKLTQKLHTDILYVLKGVGFTSEKLPFTIKGSMIAGEYRIQPQVSMQFVSGLMYALALIDGDSKIIFMDQVNTVNTDITRQVLSMFGVRVDKTDYGYYVYGNQKFTSPVKALVEGDYALSIVWQLCNHLGAKVDVGNLNANTLQTEKSHFDLLDGLFAEQTDLVVDLDLFPIFAVGSAFLKRKTTLRFSCKPSAKDFAKVNAVITALNKLGANLIADNGCVVVNGKGGLRGGAMVDCFGDFRLIMALTIAGCFADNPIKILDAQSVLKHYPTFFNDVNALGGKVQVE